MEKDIIVRLHGLFRFCAEFCEAVLMTGEIEKGLKKGSKKGFKK